MAAKKKSRHSSNSTAPGTRRSASIWDDPIVRYLGIAIAIVVIGGLMTFVMLIVYGTVPTSFVPKTAQQADVAEYQTAVAENQSPDDWVKLIMALGRSDRVEEAKKELSKLKASEPDLEQNQAIAYSEAFIMLMEEKYAEATPILEKVRKDLLEAYNIELAKTDKELNWAKANGIPMNWLRATINLEEIFALQGKDQKALDMLNEYLERRPNDASIIVMRAQLELKMGNLKAAEKDFNQAAKYLPDDEEIIKGLEQVKAAK